VAHEMKELAAAYALGALDPGEAHEFEQHLETGCIVCREEISEFDSTIVALGLIAEPVEPPERIRRELEDCIRRDCFRSIRKGEGQWQQMMPGVMIKQLHSDPSTGVTTSLVRMAPGTALPRHSHEGTEQVLVLEGDCRINAEELGPGDFHYAEPGSIHDTTYTRNGTLLLLIAGANYQF